MKAIRNEEQKGGFESFYYIKRLISLNKAFLADFLKWKLGTHALTQLLDVPAAVHLGLNPIPRNVFKTQSRAI